MKYLLLYSEEKRIYHTIKINVTEAELDSYNYLYMFSSSSYDLALKVEEKLNAAKIESYHPAI